jgi:hypothetical protein
MMHKLHPQTQLARASFDEAWFETVFRALDGLHDAVSDQRANTVSPVAPAEMVGWLEDIIYTAQEAIVEIRATMPEETLTTADYTG